MAAAAAGQAGLAGNPYTQGNDGATAVGPASGPAGSVPAGPWQEQGPHAESDEDRISIPGTHVPAWVVVALVVCVIAMLAATAFLLLR